MKTLLSVLIAITATMVCFGQTSRSDVQTLQAILAELRSIRSEIQMQSARTQAIEVLLFELQTQEAIVNRAIQRADAAKTKSADGQEGIRHFTAEIARDEDSLDAAANEVDKKRIANDIDRLKGDLASFKRTEQDRLSDQQQAEGQLQEDQNRYDAIQDELNAFMKTPRVAQQPSIPSH